MFRVKFLLSIVLVLFVSVVVIVRVSRHVYTELRCAREALNTPQNRQFSASSKEELVKALTSAYDFELRGGDHGDAHLLPERLATCRQVHPDNSAREIGAVLHWLSTARIEEAHLDAQMLKHADHMTGQTFKFMLTLQGNHKAVFKPKKKARNYNTSDLRRMHLGDDNHNSEIAAFHVQRLLGFNRGPFAVGRVLNFWGEVLPVANKNIRKFIRNHKKSTCIEFEAAGGQRRLCFKEKIEGVVILWLARPLKVTQRVNPSTYCRMRNFLQNDQLSYPIDDPEKLMDEVDTLVFDYLIQNLDRHVHTFEPALYSSLLILDNGKSFTEPSYERDKLLREFSVRCQIRNSTYERLKLLRGGVLSAVLRHILSRDPIAPVLWEPYYATLDRRLELVLQQIRLCFRKHSRSYVLVADTLTQLREQNSLYVYIRALVNTFKPVYLHDMLDDLLQLDFTTVLLLVACIGVLVALKNVQWRSPRYNLVYLQNANLKAVVVDM